MPKKKVEEKVEEPVDNKKADDADKKDDEVEDTAVVKALKVLDDKYCAIELEFEAAAQKLRKKCKEEHFLGMAAARLVVLNKAEDDTSAEDLALATPACKGFWLKAFQNCEWSQEFLHDHDEPVLEYLEDIQSCDLDEVHERKGTKFDFFFKENPFFTNKVLNITIFYDFDPEVFKPWMDLETKEIQSTVIDWKAGKNVTVELVQKKTKGGGAKKAKQKAKAAKEEPRASFFRAPFCNVKVGDPFPESMKCFMGGDDADEEDLATAVKPMLGQLSEVLESIDEGVTKYAVRYYTGEAAEDDDDDFSEDGEEESGDDDDEDSEASEDEPRGRGKAKGKPKKAAEPKAGAEGKKDEECKQQ